MKKHRRPRGIKYKLIIYGFRIFAPVVLVATLIIFIHAAKSKVEDMKKRSLSNTRSVSMSIALIQDEIKKMSTYISIDSDIRKILLEQNIESLNQNPRLWFEEAPMETLENLIALNGDIKTFALYPENGVRPFLRGMDGSVNHSTIERIRISKEYSFTKQKPYGMYWCPVQKATRGTFDVNRTDKIVFYREIFDLKDHTPLCFVAIGIDSETFNDVCRNASTGLTDSWVIFNTEGEVLSQAGSVEDKIKLYIQRNIVPALLEKSLEDGDENDIISFTQDGYYVSCCLKKDAYSVVCNIMSSRSYRSFAFQLAGIYTLSLGAILVALYILLLLMSHLITKPLISLSSGIQKFAEGDFTQHVDISSDDEIGDVARAFNKMVSDIQSLINENYVIKMKEKENELASLQAQINPHFLYNTLNSLYWQAMNQNNEELADNILSLSRLFQLVLSHGQQDILVENEFELIEHYLEVQKMRFGSKLQYEIHLDEKIKKEHFSKLLLQPFVENSIEHGFSNKTSECNLFISGTLQDDMMVFEIKDSGTGMTEEQIEKLFSGDTKVGHDRVGGYAIKNIIDRIHLLYGEKSDISIKSVVGTGTTVCIRVPIQGV